MRRVLIISAAALGLLIAAAGLSWLALFNTGAGRDFLTRTIEPRLGAALGGEASIGALEGSPPGQIVLLDVEMQENGETWLRIERLELDWRPLAALNGRIDIERMMLLRPALLAPPPAREKKEDAPPRPFTFPEALPQISLRDFALREGHVAEAVAGRDLSLNAAGALDMGGGDFDLRLEGASGDLLDRFNIKIAKTPTRRLAIDARIASESDGAIAALARLGGPLDFTAAGEAPLSDFAADIEGAFGAYGALEGRLSGNLDDARAVRFEGDASLGEKLAGLAAEIGDTIELDLTLSGDERGARLDIARLHSRHYTVDGEGEWRTRRNALSEAGLRLRVERDETHRPELDAWLGEVVLIEAALEPEGRERYAVTAALEGGPLSATLAEGETNLRDALRGDIRVEIAQGDARPAPLSQGAALAGRLEYANAEAALEGLSLNIGEATRIAGDARANIEQRRFALDVSGDAAPSLISLLRENTQAAGPLTFEIEAEGAFDGFDARINARAPAITLDGENNVPALDIEAALAGLPARPTGDIAAVARDGSGRLEATFRSSAGGAVNISRLAANGKDFTLRGAGGFDPQTDILRIDLAYEGGEDAEPLPGVPLVGRLSAKGTVGRSGARHQLVVEAPSLASNGIAAQALNLRLEGPPGALGFSATADAVETPGAGRIADLSLTGEADLRDGVSAVLATFEARVADMPVRLTQPARVTARDGVEIAELRAAVGARGKVALDASIAPERWRVRLDASDAPVRAAASLVDLELDLDTDRERLAHGAFSVRTRLVEDDAMLVAGDIVWNGRTLRLINNDPGDAVEMDLRLPLVLSRNPSLSVSTEGDIGGSVNYEGPVEQVAGYFPTALQTLEGALSASIELAGTTDDPKVTGVVTLADGAYTEYSTGLSLAAIEARATARPVANGSVIDIEGGARGPGQSRQTIAIEGRINLDDASRLDGVLKLDGAELSGGPVSGSTATGELRLAGPLSELSLEGAVEISELDVEIVTPETTGLVAINVTAVNGDGEAENAAPPAPPPPALSFDVRAEADDRIFVRGRGLESEWRASLRATGDTDDPLILGALNLRRGFIDFAGRRFDLTRGEIAFDRLTPNNPTLDMRAEYETGEGVLAAIEIKGRAGQPEVSLVSSPSLPQEDVMALVLFGKPATELSAIESLQMAQALAQLGGIGGFGGGGGGFARRALGLDMFNADFDSETGAASLEVGKYVADGLFVSATQDARGESGSVKVQYEITNAITVETKIEQSGDQTVSANWKRDF